MSTPERGTMNAVHAQAPGDPIQLRTVDVPRPHTHGDQLLVRVHAAGVNRSDALACRGILAGPFPRTLGRDFAGVVEQGPEEWIGRRVWGAGGGDIGLSHDGSHAQYLALPAVAVAEIPSGLDFVQAAASALAYFTASAAWELIGGVASGDTVVVTGAVGGVGGAAACLAADRGARVVGVVQAGDAATAEQDPALDVVVVSDRDEVSGAILTSTDGEGASRAIDTVGGALTVGVLGGMAICGSVCILSTPPSQATAGVDLLTFYRRELRLSGLHTGRLTAADAARMLTALGPGFSRGTLRPTRVYRTYPLADAAAAYAAAERLVPGRPVLTPEHT